MFLKLFQTPIIFYIILILKILMARGKKPKKTVPQEKTKPIQIGIRKKNKPKESKLVEIIDPKLKNNFNSTQTQKRIAKRRIKILRLATQDRIFCNAHNKYLCVEEVESHRCYMGHGRPVCKNLYWETSKKLLTPYGK